MVISDEAVVEQVLRGDVNAFEILLKRYEGLVLTIAKRHLPYEHVEEAVQDAFIRAYKSLHLYVHKKGFKYWLSAIAVRTCYDFWRKYYRSREVTLSSLSESQQDWVEKVAGENSTRNHEELSRREEAREVLDWALSQLSAEDRMVLELVYLEGLSVKEAADLLGWTTVNVKVRAFRSRKKLAKLLEKTERKGAER